MDGGESPSGPIASSQHARMQEWLRLGVLAEEEFLQQMVAELGAGSSSTRSSRSSCTEANGPSPS
eukprot:9467882-Prorocentrum_lima.AAC.1